MQIIRSYRLFLSSKMVFTATDLHLKTCLLRIVLSVVAPLTTSTIAPSTSPPNVAEQTFNKISTNSNSVWGSPPVLSYSQVLNLPKPVLPPKPLLQTDSELPSFTFRFGQKGNGKFNVPSKFHGEVLVKMKLASHVKFIQELVHFCRKPREVTRRIIKVFFYKI
jgi:hypothetical protein